MAYVSNGMVAKSSQPALDLSQAIYPRTMHGTTAFRIIGGRNADLDNTSPKTYRAMIEIAAPSFDRVRPIFGTWRTANGYTVSSCNARAAANFTDPVGTPATVTLPGGGVVAAAPGTNRQTFMVGDWLDLPSIPRDDGGIGAIVIFDCYIQTTGTIGLCGSTGIGAGSYEAFATRARHKHIWRRQNGDFVTTPSGFTSTVNYGHSPFVGVQYSTLGRIVTVMGNGDSITEGLGTVRGEGFILPACERASDLSDITFEYANVSVGGSNSTQFGTYLNSIISAGLYPDIMVRPIGSPNDMTGSITSAQIETCRKYLAEDLKTCSENNIAPILWTILPAGLAARAWGATDPLRRDYNAKTLGTKGTAVLDLATTMSGVLDVGGQMLPLAGAMNEDDLHPSDYGNSLLANAVAERLLKVV